VTYLNDTSQMDGVEVPISHRDSPPHILAGMGIRPNSPGTLTNFQFRVGTSNANSLASGFGNNFPLFPPMSIFNPLATTFNIDLPSGGGGAGTNYSEVAVSGTVLSVSSAPGGASTGGTLYTLGAGSGFCSAVNACVTSGGTILDGFKVITTDDGNAVAGIPADTLTLQGDWGPSDPPGSTYIKTKANPAGGKQVDITFEKYLYETVSDSDSTVYPLAKGADIKFTGGSNVTAEVTQSGTGAEVTISVPSVPYQMSLLRITSAVTETGSITSSDSSGNLAFKKYEVDRVLFGIDGASKSFSVPETGVLYDFTVNQPNEPSTVGVPASLTLQNMAVNTVVFGMRLGFTDTPWADSSGQPVWVYSGFGLYTAECSSG